MMLQAPLFFGRFQPLIDVCRARLTVRASPGAFLVTVGSSTDGSAFADRHRRHQLRVGANEHIVLDHGLVLVGAVIVAGDGSSANVDPAADGRVADITQVTGFTAGTEVRIFGFHKISDARAGSQLRTWPQAGEGSNITRPAGANPFQHTVRMDPGSGGQIAVFQYASGSEGYAVSQRIVLLPEPR